MTAAGIVLGDSRQAKSKRVWNVFAFAVPATLHSLYDAFVFVLDLGYHTIQFAVIVDIVTALLAFVCQSLVQRQCGPVRPTSRLSRIAAAILALLFFYWR